MNKLDNLHGFGYRKVDEHARSACSCRSLRPDYCSFAPYHQQSPNSLVEVDPKLWRGFRREVLKN
jgi:hypothetical protein